MDLRPIVAAAPEVALRGTVLRLVQQQGINSLEPLVDNLEQLARLEAMVASSKPPLRHGSRFGSRQYRGMFYGSRSRSGCLTGARLARHPLAFGRRAASTARSTPVIAYPLDLADNPCIRTWRCPPMAPSLAPLSQEPLTNTDAQLVAEACGRAIKVLGLSRDELSAVVGKHRTSIDRTGLDPKTKAGELALLLLRAYRSLHSLFGGDHTLMRHWLEQPNHHLGEQPPRLLLFRIEGLNRVANYLDALRG
ncbi:MAG: MbcA/ParS/Xre antitoxin family protein [Cyanobacteria bacterium]|nr:MbcA/ParS/Xre antitoxin family protein [Cyanobacteriota bacterium]